MTDATAPRSTARFIVLEGIDGSGKSSQVAPLVEWLRGRGHDVVACRDPGATPAGDAIRQILLHRQEIPLGPTTEMLLYMAARAQLVSAVIAPALERGAWVVSDRYLPANIVYQGHAGALDPEIIRSVGGIATGGIAPDLVLLLDLDPPKHRQPPDFFLLCRCTRGPTGGGTSVAMRWARASITS